ncbi:peptide chain release factor N(5)-glutamine methyltransferase [Ichthyenterobacterium magnum]|uniref:Release factor glutamine methyltransferase n=1 Tax=Ichthyenterobacterium magnum TaxID=1230530 RepID=A0A420DLI8_9FLAO|nr:peptide chain release factor N(5)-glutamine methyltransferase [Ichthyenterobacterium magnum]RKE95068.1 release factor glutamine methyltransferase [Ichthyenterobacterium magnum]
MILKSLRTYFNNELLGYYPETEIQSFFNLLTEHILKMKRIDVSLNLYMLVSGKKYDKYQNAINGLQAYKPIQYILGETEFYGLPFKVDNSVLIPRPETEELVDWIIKENKLKENISILDIGTGSGCIAITLAKHLPHAKIYALDISKEALKTANSNAKLNKVDVEFIEADALDFIIENIEFDIIVSNPPYVREKEKSAMKPNVLQHEPHLALFVEDDDALVFYRKIAEQSHNLLKPNGQLYFEINQYLANDIKLLLEKQHFKAIELKQDIFGNDRMVKGIKS